MYFPDAKTLNDLDLSDILNRVSDEDEYKRYINKQAGTEHYRLLTWLSFYYDNVPLIEVGSYKGFSACALSQNALNEVYSFDIHNFQVLKPKPVNVNFIIGEDAYKDYTTIIKKAPLIFYDTAHDGKLEREFLNWLKSIEYSGVILFDDILLNKEMIEFWESVDLKKKDLTSIGHITGTGIVWM